MGSHIALPPNPPATKFASQSDAHVRTDVQIKFLYHPLIYIIIFIMNNNRFIMKEFYY